ncbi:hypothetical protein CRG98_027553 [Punica granatum]|uniref:pyruvate kinase n=1 Tax=Punica granatum TaxID=22663 RepID=A0A2I0J7B9_PUNGR|nr:hypothetical protein CRG98_027553 [Punica granatum]
MKELVAGLIPHASQFPVHHLTDWMTSSSAVAFAVATYQGWFPDHASEKVCCFGSLLSNANLSAPCRPQVNQPTPASRGSTRLKRSLAWWNFTFAVPRAINEDETSSRYTFDDLENQRSSDDPHVDLVHPISRSEAGLSRSIEQLVCQSSLLDKLSAVYLHVLASEQWNASRLALCHRNYMTSAANLIHHLAIRSLDIEQLKHDAICTGLLDLGTINSHVLASVTAGIQLCHYASSNSPSAQDNIGLRPHSAESLDKRKNGDFSINALRKRASLNRERLFGTFHDRRTTLIMVTIGMEATQSESLIPDLLNKGTTVFRINCAHGDSSLWSEIIRRVRHNSRALEKPCRILMDLAGPKLRTGRLKPGPCVIKVSPKRDASGEVMVPAQVWLLQKGAWAPHAHVPPDAVLYIDGPELLDRLGPRDVLRFHDARGRERVLKINSKLHATGGHSFLAECPRTAYIHSGAEMHLKGKKGKHLLGRVVDVPASEPFIRLRVGDLLIITRDSSCEREPTGGAHRITCPSGYLFDSVKPGERIYFDDGKIEGVIQGTGHSEVIVSITRAGIRGTKLGSDKSINIPESSIRFQGLTSKDLMDLDFVSSCADMVGVSFVRDVQDIVLLRRELEQRKLDNLGIILKIETESGFKNLPLLLLEAMKGPNPLGVMIARGDLAVECGWEKLAYLQEEILSICGAAHVPVLESLVKSGVPTRAEITDVALGRRASCIMLNKGKNLLEAVATLNAILHSTPSKITVQMKHLVLSSHSI